MLATCSMLTTCSAVLNNKELVVSVATKSETIKMHFRFTQGAFKWKVLIKNKGFLAIYKLVFQHC